MTVEEARAEYSSWAGGGSRHVAQCPFADHPFHAYIWKRTEAASIAYDLAVAVECDEQTLVLIP